MQWLRFRGKTIVVRIEHVRRVSDQLHYLRMILQQTGRKPWGHTAREQLATVRGNVYGSWYEVARELGLCDPLKRSYNTLYEAVHEAAVRDADLRDLLAVLLARLQEPRDVQCIFDDFLEYHEDPECNTLHDVYIDVHIRMLRRGARLYDIMPHLCDLLESIRVPYQCPNAFAHAYADRIEAVRRRSEQSDVMDAVIHAATSHATHTRIFHLEAPRRCGKTFLATAIAAELYIQHGMNTVFGAFTNTATVLLPDGATTIHTMFSLSVDAGSFTTEIKPNEHGELPSQQHILNSSLIDLDEVTMLRRDQLDCITEELRRIDYCGVLLLCGNDAQLPPVLPGTLPHDLRSYHIVSSHAYQIATHMTLSQNRRLDAATPADARLGALALSIGYDIDQPPPDPIHIRVRSNVSLHPPFSCVNLLNTMLRAGLHRPLHASCIPPARCRVLHTMYGRQCQGCG